MWYPTAGAERSSRHDRAGERLAHEVPAHRVVSCRGELCVAAPAWLSNPRPPVSQIPPSRAACALEINWMEVGDGSWWGEDTGYRCHRRSRSCDCPRVL